MQHVSAFAFARLPLLVHFGSRLDDTFHVSIYQRHRSTESWCWPSTAETTVRFTTDSPLTPSPNAPEGVLLLNISASTQAEELPGSLTTLPRWTISPQNLTPSVDVINSLSALDEFTSALRLLLSELEASNKNLQRLHVLAAVPVSAAVALGRVHDANVHPGLVVYDRTDGRYSAALEISWIRAETGSVALSNSGPRQSSPGAALTAQVSNEFDVWAPRPHRPDHRQRHPAGPAPHLHTADRAPRGPHARGDPAR
ncbi:SAVED domain-containing protein [Streptomyces sp. NPDC093094]|uniref:SAVED domain-containing protein n=1 Tax=Streptomyces sp. NPDC093094 TaxID=3366026 RepID=UPI00380C08CC